MIFESLRRISGDAPRLVGTMLDPYRSDDPVHLATTTPTETRAGIPETSGSGCAIGISRPGGSSCCGLHPTNSPRWPNRSGWTLIDHHYVGVIYAAELRPQ